VETEAGYIEALMTPPEIVLSDNSMPRFDGMRAMKILRDQDMDIPFILVSGTIGEERVAECLKAGATDYVLKDRLGRLAQVIRRALLEVQERRERKKFEKQFIEAQKMEVVALLASGVAHDFNNILAVIMGYGEVIMGSLPPGDPSLGYAGEILQAAERAAALTRQLLLFSSKQTVLAVVLDLNDVVKEAERMLRRLVDENVELLIVSGPEIGHIKADGGHIGQILMNLVVNARDAMDTGGKITVETRNFTLHQNDPRPLATVTPGEYVRLSVSDTGTGMTDEVKTRLFEAFFTTKPRGKGTGLGLATCQTIVRQCGGHIEVVSEPGKGTTFHIYFPRVDQPLNLPQRPRPDSLSRGKETLLFVEDEPSVRQLACKILESQGYHVLHANNGRDGLRVASEWKGGPISLVITDIIMPLMGGKAMSEWLETTYPGIRVLFTSGYTDETIEHQGVLESGVAFLPKPYTPAALRSKVRELLDGEISGLGREYPDETGAPA